MLTSDFDFELPPHLIAQHPVEPRDSSRLMVLDRASGTWEHRVFRELPEILRSGDVLVRNVSKVLPARLLGRRESTGGRWEGLYLGTRPNGSWELLGKTRGRLLPGERVVIGDDLILTMLDRAGDGRWSALPNIEAPAERLLETHGRVPLPPYIRKGVEGPNDRDRYQTVFAKTPGSAAAPTAGLHFTPALIDRLETASISMLDVTLHVGIDTFRPIETERIENHAIHSELAEITEETATRLRSSRASRRRIIAVGTTSARVLETSALSGEHRAFLGETRVYIQPGHAFRGIDALITNFHLPRGSLLVLVSAFAGLELIREAYREAIREKYRFYSYGDAMLIL